MLADKDVELKYGCRICKAQATGFHFDAQSCSACAAFFRRTVALNRHFNCITGCNNCFVHYSVRQICRACRFRRCLEEGMKKNCVQPKKTEWEKRRAFCTKSGLKRNKKFAIKLHVNTITNEQYEIANSPITQYSIIAGSSTSSSSPQTESLSCCPERFSDDWDVATSPVDASKCWCRSVSDTPSDIKIDHKYLAPKYDILQILIAEEMRIGERRRIMFCERPVCSLLGMTPTCPFTVEEIRPLRFRDFRKSIRTHILLIYEWLRSWPEYGTIAKYDQITFLRKCVLYHTILDPCYITIQIGYPHRFVMQNGGYVGTEEESIEGWEDEKEISGDTKQRIYRPLLRKMMSEVVTPMVSMNISFEEFVALKAFVSWQGTTSEMSEQAKPAMRRTLDALFRSLHQHYLENNIEVSERLGNIVLLLSSVFATGLKFVESHHEIAFFDLWQLDSLLIQLLKCK